MFDPADLFEEVILQDYTETITVPSTGAFIDSIVEKEITTFKLELGLVPREDVEHIKYFVRHWISDSEVHEYKEFMLLSQACFYAEKLFLLHKKEGKKQ